MMPKKIDNLLVDENGSLSYHPMPMFLIVFIAFIINIVIYGIYHDMYVLDILKYIGLSIMFIVSLPWLVFLIEETPLWINKYKLVKYMKNYKYKIINIDSNEMLSESSLEQLLERTYDVYKESSKISTMIILL